MKLTCRTVMLATALAALSIAAPAKDEPIKFEQCPAPVQTVIRHYSRQGTLEAVSVDEKKKSGGAAVYEARFSLPGGKRVEVHISPEGKVLQFEEKKPKS